MTPVKTQLANLIQLAKADGQLAPEEVMLIFGIAERHGLTKYDMDDIVAKADEWSTVPPADQNERMVFFYQLLILATVDKQVDASEAVMLKRIGGELGLHENNVDEAINHILENTQTDLSEVEIRAILGAGLN
ncbi:MAG: hypothetical protein ACON34_10965 [Flavobacteriales bacterium]